MDDRIFLVRSIWCGGAHVYNRWPAVRAQGERLRSFLPVDEFVWPFHHGESADDPVEATLERMASAITPNHHVVDDGGTGGEGLLLALTRSGVQPRSLVYNGFFAQSATLRSAGFPDAATAISVAWQVVSNPNQVAGVCMQDAAEEDRKAMSLAMQQDVNQADLVKYVEGIGLLHPYENVSRLRCPSLYLELPVAVPGTEQNEAILSHYLADLRVEPLLLYGLRLHEEAGGHEVADKVIPFIKEVIAAREA